MVSRKIVSRALSWRMLFTQPKLLKYQWCAECARNVSKFEKTLLDSESTDRLSNYASFNRGRVNLDFETVLIRIR